MKVKASMKGQYKGIMYYPGDVFEFDEKDLNSPISPWMVPVKEVEKRSEERTPESEQLQAKKKGWA